MYENILSQAGLSENETAIYSLLLTAGACTAAEIATQTGVKRANVYYILEKLIEYGLVEKTKKGKKTFFHCEHPGKLKGFVEQRKKTIEQAEHVIDAALPSLLADFNLVNSKPGVYMFEGKEGVIKAYEELLDDGLRIDSIEDSGEMKAFIPEYIPVFIQKRIRKKIANRVIAPSTNTVNVTSAKELRETHFVPVSKLPFTMDIKMTEQKVIMTTFKKNTAVGIIIIHPEIVRNFTVLFEFFWSATTGQETTASNS